VKQISLIARFEPHGGNTVLGEQTKHMLPGISKADPEYLVKSGVGEMNIAKHTEQPSVQNVVKQLSAEIPMDEAKSAGANNKENNFPTTTIALPKKWERRLSTPTK
jgi:hypothetical protein